MAIHELKRTLYQDQPDSTSINHETRDHLQDSTHFHLPALHMHHANLHHWGIASGLSVEQTGPAQLTIKEGLAMDLEGRLIPLASIGEEIGQPGKAFINTTSNLVDVPVVFPIGSSVADGSYYLTIELPLQVTDTAGVIEGRLVTEGRSRRIISTPLIRLQPAVVPFSDHGKAIILATVVIAGGLVTSLNGSSDRQLAGVTVGKIIFKKGGEVGAGPEVGDESAGGISCDRFGLSVTVPDPPAVCFFLRKEAT